MTNQKKYKSYEEAELFPDGSAMQPPVPGTVWRGEGAEQAVLDQRPPMTMALLERGRERFDIFCSPCHGRSGDGQGIIVQRGFPQPPSYHIDRLRDAPRPALPRRDPERLRRHVLLRRARAAGRPLGDRRLHPRPAARPARDGRGPARETSGSRSQEQKH